MWELCQELEVGNNLVIITIDNYHDDSEELNKVHKKQKKIDSKSEFLQNIKNTNNIWAELFLKLRSESKKPQTKI